MSVTIAALWGIVEIVFIIALLVLLCLAVAKRKGKLR